jgi:drug/metabolite transporter (DMT)-like permease
MDASIGILFGLLAMVGWGIADFFVACAVRKANAMIVLFWSMLVIFLLSALVVVLLAGTSSISVEMLVMVLICGLLGVVSWGAYYKGMSIGKVAIVSPIANTWPALTVILSLLFLGESLTGTQSIGVVFAIIGTVLISFKFKDIFRLKDPAKGASYALVGVFGWGLYFVLFGVLVDGLGWFFPLFLIKTSTVAYLATYFKARKLSFSVPRKALVLVALIGVFETMASLAYGLGITFQYTAIIAPIIAGVPMVTVLLARIFFREKVEFNQGIGIMVIIAGLVLLAI